MTRNSTRPGRLDLRLRIVAGSNKRIHELARTRKARRHTQPIEYDNLSRRYIYADGTPVDRDDPRLRQAHSIGRDRWQP